MAINGYQVIIFGDNATARAMPTRWHIPR
jgi:hypothetical protein